MRSYPHSGPYVQIILNWTVSLLLIFLISPTLPAQINADSILQSLTTVKKEEIRLERLDSICHNLLKGQERNAGKIFEARLALGEKISVPEANIQRAIDGSDYYLRNQNGTKATALIQPYLEQITSISNTDLKINLLDMRAAIHSEQDEFDPAIKIYQQIIEIMSEPHEPPILQNVSIWRNLGKNLYGAGRYSESSITLNQARDIALEQKDSNELNYIYLELGNLFGRIGLYDEAINYFKERHKYFSTPSEIAQLIDLTNFGNTKLAQQQYASSLPYFQKGLSQKPYPNQWEMLELYYLTGLIEGHYFLNNQDSVNFYFDKINEAFEALDQTNVYAFLYDQSQYFYFVQQKQYAKAEQILNRLYEKSKTYNNDSELLKYTLYFSDLYRSWGKYDLALQYADTYNEINDSIQTSNKVQALLLYQTQYETKEKENTIQTLEKEKEIQELQALATRNRFIGGGIALLLLGGVLFTRQFYRNKIQRAAQIEKLRTKISSDLHDDVGSILTGLAMQTEIMEYSANEIQKPKLRRITELSRSAMSRMRDAVWAMDARKDNWKSLIDRMHEFANEALEGSQIQFQLSQEGINGEGELSATIRQNIYLIFKEAITNVIKHAQASQINTSLTHNAGKIQMIIQDNGVTKEQKPSAGLGLSNIQMRADQMNAQLDIQQGHGFTVQLTIPNQSMF